MGATKGTGDVDVADAIGALEVERVVVDGPSSELRTVPLGSLWAEQPVLIHLLRRFGCQLCRAGALEMGKIFPQLEAHGVLVVGIGLESVGLEEFRKGGFWNGGELYIDHGKKIHKALSFPKVGVLNSLKMLLANKDVKSALKRSKDTPGDLKGDGRQLGGTFVIARGGASTLLEFRQAHFGDHASNAAILEALGLDVVTPAALPASSPAPALQLSSSKVR